MADPAEQIEIELEDAPDKAKDGDIEVLKAEDAPAKPAAKVMEPEEGLETLKAQLEQEKAERIAQTNRANKAEETAHKAKNEVQDSNLTLVTNAIETVKQSNEVLKANYSAAMSAGDYDRASEVQLAMSTNAAKLLQLEQGKQALENAPKAEKPRQIAADPVEALASQLTPRSAAWVRAHPQCATNNRLYSKMLAAHNLAISDDIAPDTDAYFEKIENIMGFNKREEIQNDDPMAGAAVVTQRRSAPPAAPVSRSGNGTGSKPNVVRLTSAEREIAQMNGMSDVEYAKAKLALQREGKLN